MTVRLATGGALGAMALGAAVLGVPTPAYSHKPITTNIIFKNEIAQIFQRKCFQCHSERNLGVSLTTYTDARPWARAIREEILDRRMPPWTAVPGYGHFSNDISLSAREMEVIVAWADGGAPSGVPRAEEPVAPVYVPAAPEWALGPPDLTLPVSPGQLVAPGAPFELKRFVVATRLDSARRLRAIALKQGDRRVVRHAAFYEEATGRWLGAWTPWQTSTSLPLGYYSALPANVRIVVEIGYTGSEEPVTDASEIGLYFEKAAGVSVDAVEIAADETPMAAGAAGHRVRAETSLAADVSAIALWPNPSPGARSIEITATTPEGVISPLLWIKDYRQEWRSPYFLSSPVTLPRGTRIAMTTYFDNPGEKSVVARAQAWLLTAASKSGPRPPRN